jgi:diaminohydroxyphosphoribosylaminopyrimidine deaminase / 5-amino-6-(5-phosphoribosylamino)uracil reductase
MQSFIKRALEFAKLRKGFCAPNPAVGAVIVQNGRVLAEGYHLGPHYPHAEIEALKKLPSNLNENLDLYVTLEPCCHQGKTPPCTQAILDHKISRVFYGLIDPDERVAGKGIALLERAGVICKQLNLPEINDFYQSYIYWQKYKTPYVTAKLAISADGKIAGSNGSPLKISGPIADQFTHQQRKYADALFTTARTIHRDNPQLNVRLVGENFKKPIYVLDRSLSIPLTAKIFSTAQSITLFHNQYVCKDKISHYQDKGAICIPIPNTFEPAELPWHFMLNEIGKSGVHDLWVEAGARCFESLLAGQYVQQAYLYCAPKYIGSEGLAAFSEKEQLFGGVKKIECQMLGEDMVCRLKWA